MASDPGDSASNQEEVTGWPPMTRVANKDWCDCSCCSPMLSRLDYLCCHDAAPTLTLIEEEAGAEVSCVSQLEAFQLGCLNCLGLKIALGGYLDLTTQQVDTSGYCQ